jgi:hypothetical protein
MMAGKRHFQTAVFWLIAVLIPCTLLAGTEYQQEQASKYRTRFLPLPVLFYRPQTSLAFGAQVKTIFRLGKNKELARPSTISPEVIYTFNKQFITKIISDIYLAKNSWHFYADLDFRKFPDLFYGVGNHTQLESEEAYTTRMWEIDLHMDRHIDNGFHLGLHIHLLDWKLTEKEFGGLLAGGTVPGSEYGTATGTGLRFIYDTRDHIFYPRYGELFQILFTYYHHLLGSTFDFSCLTVNLRKYLPLGRNQALAFQILLESQYGDIPFLLMSQLGGADRLRGFYTGRFRDKNLLLFQGEWRIPVFWRTSVSVFAALGQVAGQLNHFDFSQFHYSLGFGLRYLYNKRESLNARMDFGWGEDSKGVYMEGSESF